jgi:hypothetical protein
MFKSSRKKTEAESTRAKKTGNKDTMENSFWIFIHLIRLMGSTAFICWLGIMEQPTSLSIESIVYDET